MKPKTSNATMSEIGSESLPYHPAFQIDRSIAPGMDGAIRAIDRRRLTLEYSGTRCLAAGVDALNGLLACRQILHVLDQGDLLELLMGAIGLVERHHDFG